MFKRIRKSIQDAGKSNSPQPSTPTQDLPQETTDATSGFICPMCMDGFTSGDLLQVHFDEAHSAQLDSGQSPAPQVPSDPEPVSNEEVLNGDVAQAISNESNVKDSHVTNGEPLHAVDKLKTPSDSTMDIALSGGDTFSNVRMDVESKPDVKDLNREYTELETTLKEEKWYSNELKQELDKKDNELRSQIEELEIVKQQMTIAIGTNEELAREKEKVMEKLIGKTEECATLQSVIDEFESEKLQYTESAKNQSAELEKAATWIRDLEAQLIERPGADDVLVLKKELVSVQQLMDQLTLDGEKRLEEAMQACKDLEEEKSGLLKEIENMKSTHEKDLVRQKESATSQTAEESKLREEIANVEATLRKEREHSRALELEINAAEEQRNAEKEGEEEAQSQLRSLRSECAKIKNKHVAMSSELAAKDEELSRAKGSLKESRRDLEDATAKTDAALREKLTEIESLSRQYGDAAKEVASLKKELDDAVASRDATRENLTAARESRRQFELDKSLEIQKLEQSVESLTTKLTLSSTSDTELREKVRVSEDEAKKAWNDIQEERTKNRILSLEHENRVSSLTGEKVKLEEELRSLRACVDEADKAKISLEAAVLGKETLVQSLQSKLDSLQRDSDGLERDLDEARKRTDSAVREKTDILSDVKRLQQERNDLMGKMEVGEGQAALVSQLRDENDSLTKRLEDLRGKAKDDAAKHGETVKKLEDDLASGADALRRLEESVASANSAAQLARDTVESKENEKSVLEKKLEDLHERLKNAADMSAARDVDFENRVAALQRSFEDKSREFDRLSAEYERFKASAELSTKATEASVTQLRDSLNTVRQDNVRIVAEKSSLVEEVEAKAIEVNGLKSSLDAEKTRHRADVDSAETRHRASAADFEERLKSARDRFAKAEAGLEAAKTDAEGLRGKLADSTKVVEEFKTDLDERESVIVDLKSGRDSARSESIRLTNDLSETKQSHAVELETLKSEHFKLVEEMKLENKTVCDSLKNEMSEINVKLEESVSDLNRQLEQRNAEASARITEIIKLKSSIEEKGDAALNAAARFSAEKETLTGEIRDLTEKVGNLTVENETLSEARDSVSSELREKAGRLSAADNRIAELESGRERSDEELQAVEAKLEATRQTLEDLTREKDSISQELGDSQKSLEETRLERDERGTTVATLRERLESVVAEKEEFEAKANDMESKWDAVKLSLKSTEEQLVSAKQSFAEKEKETDAVVETMRSEIATLKDEVSDRKAKYEEQLSCRDRDKRSWDDEKTRMTEDMDDKASRWDAERAGLLQTQETLTDARQILIEAKTDLQKQLDEKCVQLQREKERFEGAAASHRHLLEKITGERELVEAKLEGVNRDLKTAHDEKERVEARLQLEVSTLRDNLDSVRGEWQQALRHAEESDAELEEARGRVVSLQAAAQNSADERRALLERCVTAEQSVERRKESEAQLRKRLDNAQAAMHELGRENQAMQVKHSTVLSRQWADDREAVECNACRKPFSITVRRHHCRHCGKIFCADCSDKSATVAASKKPVRVCEKCYDDLLTVQ